MKIFPISDLHIDHNGIDFLKDLNFSKDAVTVVAGDIASWASYDSIGGIEFNGSSYKKFHDAMRFISEKSLAVVIVLGNHDYNGLVLGKNSVPYASFDNGNISPVPSLKFIYDLGYLNNVHVLHQGQSAQVEDHVFVGSTLWTDVFKADPLLVYQGKNMLFHDFKSTMVHDDQGIREFSPSDWVAFHEADKTSMKKVIEAIDPRFKIVAVTHMSPFFESIVDPYRTMASSAYFACTDMESFLDHDIKLWIHGHTHRHMDYMIGNCRVVCNAYGYPRETGTRFNRNFTVSI